MKKDVQKILGGASFQEAIAQDDSKEAKAIAKAREGLMDASKALSTVSGSNKELAKIEDEIDALRKKLFDLA